MKKTLLLLPMILLLACNNTPIQKEPADTMEPAADLTAVTDSLRAALTAIVEPGLIHGFGVVIADKSGSRYADGIGMARVADQQPYTAQTIQNIGSVSKTLIGIALLKAQELGKLELDDPVNKHLPFEVVNPHFPETPITIRQLSTHTSSILDTDYYNEEAYLIHKDEDLEKFDLADVGEKFNPVAKKMTMGDFLQKLLAKDGEWYSADNYLKQEPGTFFEYSNIGATLAAFIIEQSTGSSYDEFTSTHILQPLGMSASGWSLNEIDLNKHSTLYSKPGIPLPHYSLITYPDGGLLTSPEDMGKYLSELIKGQAGEGTILQPESYKMLFQGQLTDAHFSERDEETIYNDEYDLGVFMGISAKGYYGHTGGDPGIASFMFFNPETGTGKFMMINTSISSEEAVNQFFSVWQTLERYESNMKQ